MSDGLRNALRSAFSSVLRTANPTSRRSTLKSSLTSDGHLAPSRQRIRGPLVETAPEAASGLYKNPNPKNMEWRMELSPKQRERLFQALLSAFRSEEELRQMVRL